MIKQRDNKQFRKDSWLLKLLSRDMKQNKKQRSTKKQSQKITEK